MNSYVTIIITVLLGLIGLISKTKKDGGPSTLNKLTPFGYVVLVLLIISLIVNLYSQKEKDKAAESEKNKLMEKAKQDSIRQDETLKNLEELQHPISPLQVQVEFTVYLSKIPEQDKETVRKYVSELYEMRNDHNRKYPINFRNYLMSDELLGMHGTIECDDLSPGDDSHFDAAFIKLNRLIYNYLLPEVWFYFYKSDINPKVDIQTANLFLIANGIENLAPTYNNDFKLSYKYYPQLNQVDFKISFNDPYIYKKERTINSMYSIRNGSLAISLHSFNHNCDVELLKVDFKTGNNYYDWYSIDLKESNVENYKTKGGETIYIIKGNQILSRVK